MQNPNLLMDYGPHPFVVDISKATLANNNYRTTLWTGPHLQLTVMSIPVGQDIGLEVHPDNDQFIRIEQGTGVVQMGNSKDNLYFQQLAFDDSGVFVPANTWHNITNIGKEPMKLYTIYSPVHHPFNTIHETKEVADREGD